MKQIFLLGDPVAHSKSPVFQNAGIRACGLEASYETKLVQTAGEMESLAKSCRSGAFHGANVTLPHKAVAASVADVVTPAVDVAGVANTWWRVGGELYADNTDIYGIQASVAALDVPSIANVIVLGAGGAAVGALFALRHVARTVSIANRTLSTGRKLAAQAMGFSDAEFTAYPWPTAENSVSAELAERFRNADLIIQATSLPVHRPEDAEPFAEFPWNELPPGAGLLELCYAADDTVAVRQAKAQQLRTLDGATMLLHQGLRSFERWFDVEAPAVVMRDALADALGRPSDLIPATPDRSVLGRLRRDQAR